MTPKQAFDRFEKWLEGWPNQTLTIALLVAAGVLVYLAFYGKPMDKAIAMAYVTFP